MPTGMLAEMWNDERLEQLKDAVKEASLETLKIVKRISTDPKATLNDLLLMFPLERWSLIRSAADNHTFVTEVDEQNGTVKFKRNQSDFLPPILLDTSLQHQTTKVLLTADLIVECLIFALNLVGYPVTSLKKIRETLLKVKRILQSKDMLSFFSQILEASGSSKLNLIFDLLFGLYQKGLLSDLVRELIDGTGLLDRLKAVGKLTGLIMTAAKHFTDFPLAENLLKGSELLVKISTLRQLSVDFKSKL